MPDAILHRYLDRGHGGFANIALPSGERVFLSLAVNGLRLHRMHLWGLIPGKTLYVADAAALVRMCHALARHLTLLAKLPAGPAMDSFLVTASEAIANPEAYSHRPQDEDGHPMTNLVVLTRAALAAKDAESLVRRLSRAAATL
jgi:hypothetical protein